MRLILSLVLTSAALYAADPKFYYPLPDASQVEVRKNIVYAIPTT